MYVNASISIIVSMISTTVFGSFARNMPLVQISYSISVEALRNPMVQQIAKSLSKTLGR